MEYQIVSGVQAPTERVVIDPFPFERLEAGQAFFVELTRRDRCRLSTRAYRYSAANGVRLRVWQSQDRRGYWCRREADSWRNGELEAEENRAKPIPDSWTLTPALRAAVELKLQQFKIAGAIDVEGEAGRFAVWSRRVGYTAPDWDRAFIRWCLGPAELKRERSAVQGRDSGA